MLTARKVQGVPLHPGRARLLTFHRPAGYHAPVRRTAPASELVAFGVFVALCASLVTFGWRQETIVEQAQTLEDLNETNENLLGLYEQAQCELLHIEADRLEPPGGIWPSLATALTPEKRAFCRGGRSHE